MRSLAPLAGALLMSSAGALLMSSGCADAEGARTPAAARTPPRRARPQARPTPPARARPVAVRPRAAPPGLLPVARRPGAKPLDCSKPAPATACCRSESAACRACRRKAAAVQLGWRLKCKLKVPRWYVVCGCGCCGGGGRKGRRPLCIYFQDGRDIREMIEQDRRARKNKMCGVMGCAFGTLYTYCD